MSGELLAAFFLQVKLMTLRCVRLITLTIFICLLFCQPSKAQEYPSQEEHDWVSSHLFDVLEEFLPIEEADLGYRSYRDLYTDVLEYSLVFNRDWKGKRVSVVVRMADSVSLYDQIMALHRKNPSESIKSIKTKLKVKEWRYDAKACLAVESLYDGFYRLNLAMLTAKDRAEQAKGIVTITLHPTVHIFKASISGGNLRLALTEQEHPFVIWANKARRALERCATSKRG
jgi:hypothetical protein